MTDEIPPAVGVALKPQLQGIPAKALSFEDAEQLIRGNGDTTRKGIWEQAWALSSRLALEASVAIVKPTPHLPSLFHGPSVASSSSCLNPHLVRMQDTGVSVS